MVKERPIIFNTEMVKAILDGRKTQTRRVIKIPESGRIKPGTRINDDYSVSICYDLSGCADWKSLKCPDGKIGDGLWVRETWFDYYDEALFKADMDEVQIRDLTGSFKPSIFMPRWASRIDLEITDIRVERVQSISNQDAMAEGVSGVDWGHGMDYGGYANYLPLFKQLWDSINAKRGYGWEVNPWVWVIEF